MPTSRPSTVVLILALVGLVAVACAAAPPASVDPVTGLRVAAPWVLDDAFPEVSQQLVDGVLGEEGFRAATVKHVTGPDGEAPSCSSRMRAWPVTRTSRRSPGA